MKRSEINQAIKEMITMKEYIQYVQFANAAASLCVEKRGGIPAMPREDEIPKRLLEGTRSGFSFLTKREMIFLCNVPKEI